jgi:hypothetical protein
VGEMPRIVLEPVESGKAIFLVLRDGMVIGTVLPSEDLRGPGGETYWLATASAESGGTSWPCGSQAAAVQWLVRNARSQAPAPAGH